MENEETRTLLNDLSSFWSAFLEQLPQIGIGLVLFITFYLLAGPLSRLLIKPLVYAQRSDLIKVVVRRIISLVIILFGFYLFLRLAGLSTFAVAILSGTGVAGLIIGFAFKDIAENFMSSLLLSIQKPFRLGDVIEVNGFLGVAKQVTARATTLIDFDGNHIQIPNSVVYKNTIRNLTANPNSRGKFVIGIGYDADVNQAQKIGLEVMTNIKSILTDPEPQVLVDQLGSSTLNLKVYFWINTHNYSLSKVASVAMKSIVLAFEEAGISMPDDAREVIFPQGVPVHDTHKTKLDSQSKNSPKKYQATSDSKIKPSAAVKTQNANDDVESDDADIRKQAKLSRDPEQGSNIL